MSIRVQQEDFDVGDELQAFRQLDKQTGAVVSFVGLVRDQNSSQKIHSMTLEHYPSMTEQVLTDIEQLARERWELLDVLVIHRIGELLPTDQIVLVMVSSAHRGEAFSACEFLMDYLKTKAPFWKKEKTDCGSHWIEARNSDNRKVKRWQESKPLSDTWLPLSYSLK